MMHSPLLNESQPFTMLVAAPFDLVEVRFLQPLGDRAALAVADSAVVELADRRDFGGSAGEERFIADIHFVSRDALLAHFDTDFARQLEHGVACCSFQR